MKIRNILIGLVFIILILGGIGAGIWFWLQKAPDSSPAQFLPQSTVFYAEIPNGTASYLDYQNSKMKKIVGSQEIQAIFEHVSAKFLESSKDQISDEEWKKLKELWESFAVNFNGQSFFAITGTQFDFEKFEFDDSNPLSVVAGFQPKVGSASFMDFVEKLKAFDHKEKPELKSGKINHNGTDYEWVTFGECPVKLFYIPVKEWHFFVTGEEEMKQFVDSYQSVAQPLSELGSFKTMKEKIGPNPDTFFFVNFDGAVEKIVEKNSKMEEGQKQLLLETYSGFQAFMGGLYFEEGNIVDRWAIHYPGDKRPDLGKMYEPCAYKTLSFSSDKTLLYGAQNYDFVKYYAYMKKIYQQAMPELNQSFEQAESAVAAYGFDLQKNLLEPIGPEIAYLLDWHDGDKYPGFTFLLEINDREKFEPVVEKLVMGLQTMAIFFGSSEESTLDNYRVLKTSINEAPFISPTLFIGKDVFGVSLSYEEAEQRIKKSSKTLKNDSEFQRLAAKYQAESSAMLFVKTSDLLKKGYTLGLEYKPLIQGYVEMDMKIEGFELPDELSFADALGTSWLSSEVSEDYVELKSESPLGNQFIASIGMISALTLMGEEIRKNFDEIEKGAGTQQEEVEEEKEVENQKGNGKEETAADTENKSDG